MGTGIRFERRLLVALGGLLAAFVLFLAWGQGLGSRAAAQTPGLDFSIAVAGKAGCDTMHGDTQCVFNPGERFTLNVSLNAVPAELGTYSGFDIEVDYTGVTSADNASTASWPDCGFPATFYRAGLVSMGCAVALPPAGPSTYTGVIGTSDFTCTQSGSIALKHGQGNTDLVDTQNVVHAEGAGTSETLTVYCGPPPTPTLAPGQKPPGLPSGGTAGPSGSGDDPFLWASVAALLVLGFTGISVIGWRRAHAR